MTKKYTKTMQLKTDTIRELIRTSGKHVTTISRDIGITRNYLFRPECSILTAVRIAHYFGVTLDDILEPCEELDMLKLVVPPEGQERNYG